MPKKVKKEQKIEEAAQSDLNIIANESGELLPEAEEKNSLDGKGHYYESIGRRKESIARVRLFTRKSADEVQSDKALITVNGKDYTDYFRDTFLASLVEEPLRRLKSLNRFKALVHVRGGGISGQAQAVTHGISRALEKFDANFRKKLKKSGLLKRDPRAKERRKYGLKKARKAPQWRKR